MVPRRFLLISTTFFTVLEHYNMQAMSMMLDVMDPKMN